MPDTPSLNTSVDTWYQRFNQLHFANRDIVKSFCYLVVNMDDDEDDDVVISRIVASLKLALHKGVPAVELMPLLAWFRLANFTDHELVEKLKSRLEDQSDHHCQLLVSIARRYKLANDQPQDRGFGEVNLFGEIKANVFASMRFAEEERSKLPAELLSLASSFHPIKINEALDKQMRIRFDLIREQADTFRELFGWNILMILDFSIQKDDSLTQYLMSKIDEKTLTYQEWFSQLSQVSAQYTDNVFSQILSRLRSKKELLQAVQETPLLYLLLSNSKVTIPLDQISEAVSVFKQLTKEQVMQLVDNNVFSGITKIYHLYNFYEYFRHSMNDFKPVLDDHYKSMQESLLLLRDQIVLLFLEVDQGVGDRFSAEVYSNLSKDKDIFLGLQDLLEHRVIDYQKTTDFKSLYDLWITHESNRTVIKALFPTLRYTSTPYTIHELIAFYLKQQFDVNPDGFSVERAWMNVASEHFFHLLPLENDSTENNQVKSKQLNEHYRKALVAAFESATTRHYQEVIVGALERQMGARQAELGSRVNASSGQPDKIAWWSESTWWDMHDHPINVCILRDNEAGLAFLFAKNYAEIADAAIENGLKHKNVKVINYLAQLNHIKKLSGKSIHAILVAIGYFKLWSYISEFYFIEVMRLPKVQQAIERRFNEGNVNLYAFLLERALGDNAIEAVNAILSSFIFYQLNDVNFLNYLYKILVKKICDGEIKVVNYLLRIRHLLNEDRISAIIEKSRSYNYAGQKTLEAALFPELEVNGQINTLVKLKLGRNAFYQYEEKCKIILALLNNHHSFNEGAGLRLLQYAVSNLEDQLLTQVLEKLFALFSFSDVELSELIKRAGNNNKFQFLEYVFLKKIENTGLMVSNHMSHNLGVIPEVSSILEAFLTDDDLALAKILAPAALKEEQDNTPLLFVLAVCKERWGTVKALLQLSSSLMIDIELLNRVLLKAVHAGQVDVVTAIVNQRNSILPGERLSLDVAAAARNACHIGQLDVLFAIQSQCPEVIIESVSPANVGHNQFLHGLSGRAIIDDEEIYEVNRASILVNFKKLYQYLTQEQYGIGFGLFKSRRWGNATTSQLGDIIYYGLTKPSSRTAAALKLMLKFYQSVKEGVTEQQANQETHQAARQEAFRRGRGLRYKLFAKSIDVTDAVETTVESTVMNNGQ